MKKFGLVVDILFSLIVGICMFFDFIVGVHNHDAYYLIIGFIDWEILKFTLKNIKEDVDNINNM